MLQVDAGSALLSVALEVSDVEVVDLVVVVDVDSMLHLPNIL